MLMASPALSSSSISIPLPSDPSADTLIIPASSPVKFNSFGKYDVAKFTGRFVLTGKYLYGHLGLADDQPHDLSLYIDPDQSVLSTLPYWKVRKGPKHIYIINADDFAKTVVPSEQRTKLRNGTLQSVQGHISVVLTDYKAWIECDSANYSARFIAVAHRNNLIAMNLRENFGCG